MTLAPSSWPEDERAHFWALETAASPHSAKASGSKGAVTTAIHPLATRTALEALKQGGSAVDAALTASLTQIALGAGDVISYAGIFSMAHYEAATGEVATLEGGWTTCREETDPLSIPGGVNAAAEDIADMIGGTPTGRGALVGGFMKAVEAAHKRFGRLPFARLFEPAIELAEQGFEIGAELGRHIAWRGDDLKRLPATAKIFCRPDGALRGPGDWLRQPELAETLRRVAAEGADYMYKGEWARRCVAAVQAEGGKMTLEDRALYEPEWSEPIRQRYGDRELVLVPGALAVVEALNMAEAAGLRVNGHWTRSARSFNDLALLTSGFVMSYLPKEHLPPPFDRLDMSPAARLTKGHAEDLWSALNTSASPLHLVRAGGHSDNVVVADAEENAVAICHSSNSMLWGKTALMVDGVSIHDPAVFQQRQIHQVGPGARLPMPIEIGLVLKHGELDLAFASMAMGLHQKTICSLLNVLEFGMDVVEANLTPALCLPTSKPDDFFRQRIRVPTGAFDPVLLKDSGLDVMEVSEENVGLCEGIWVAVQRDPKTGALLATAPPNGHGYALAH